MTQTLLEEIWEKTIQSLDTNPQYDSRHLEQITSAVEQQHLSSIESVLKQEYEDQVDSN